MSVQLDLNRIPRHIAIIMDGNGRWAKARGQERTVGHQQGAQQVHEIMEEAVRLGVDYLTLYTFSTENWNRPKEEITALMALLLQHLDEDTFMKNPIVQDAVAHLAEITKNNTNTCMVVALSYSSKWELTKAMQDIAAEVEQGKLKSTDITEETINQHLETKGMPEPELMIRTGGELRLSNYLLWQCAYSEFYFTDVYWPDFTIDEFRKAIADYQGRQRRYGKTGDQIVEETNK